MIYYTLLTLLVPSMHGCQAQFNYALSRACAFGQKITTSEIIMENYSTPCVYENNARGISSGFLKPIDPMVSVSNLYVYEHP